MHWVETGDTYFSPLNISPRSLTLADVDSFVYYGYIFRLSLVWKLDFFPISPFFLAIVLADVSSAMSDDFIQAVSPISALRLATWPPQEVYDIESGTTSINLTHMKDPMTMLNSCNVDFADVSHFTRLRLQSLKSPLDRQNQGNDASTA